MGPSNLEIYPKQLKYLQYFLSVSLFQLKKDVNNPLFK